MATLLELHNPRKLVMNFIVRSTLHLETHRGFLHFLTITDLE